MNFENIEKLAEIVEKYKLSEIDYKDNDSRITLKGAVAAPVTIAAAPAVAAAPAAAPAPAAASEAPAAAPAVSDENLEIITSELVGTYYSAASPDSAPYIQVGDEVSVDQTVCIIEAMKVMNEIKSEVNGTVVEILVDNGTPVEYGQAIIKIKPN